MSSLEKLWSSRGPVAFLLLPISLLYGLLVRIHRSLYISGIKKVTHSTLPVVVVGNITVGGTGKTPLTGKLVEQFRLAGWRPGIVSRGYGGTSQANPVLVGKDSSACDVGDEPLMLARQTGVPVCVCTERAKAAAFLADTTDVNLIISDDGLQHHAMERHVNIAVLNGERGLGNGFLLPAGPLREPAGRLQSVDLIAVQNMSGALSVSLQDTPGLSRLSDSGNIPPSGSFFLELFNLRNLETGESISLEECGFKQVHAVAGIGHPDRFFHALESTGMQVISHAKPDHHLYSDSDVVFGDDLPVLVTSKDAVKIRALSAPLAHIREVVVRVCIDDKLRLAIDDISQSLLQASVSINKKRQPPR